MSKIILTPIETVGTGHPNHTVIEGDNIHSLNYLLETYENKINIIITDPPYNTSKSFTYTDKYGSHSDWVEFMRPRLKLAHKLLTDDGIFFIHIDDNEFPYLKLLLDEIFGEENFLTTFVWVQTASNLDDYSHYDEILTVGTNLGDIKHSHEYVLTYRKTSKGKIHLLPNNTESLISRVTKKGNTVKQIVFPKGLRLETGETKTFTGTIGGVSEPVKIITPTGLNFIDGVLQEDTVLEAEWSVPNMLLKHFNNETVIDRRGQKLEEIFFTKTGLPYMRKTSAGTIPSSILSGYGDTSRWAAELKKIVNLPKNFDYPKPTPLTKKLIQMGSQNKNSIVLDFFAGSGTTGHAVLELNSEDGGERSFIMLNNNEGNICETITFPRVKKVLTGKSWADNNSHPKHKGTISFSRITP
jgi:adenine-specific DNA-methyltransferase